MVDRVGVVGDAGLPAGVGLLRHLEVELDRDCGLQCQGVIDDGIPANTRTGRIKHDVRIIRPAIDSLWSHPRDVIVGNASQGLDIDVNLEPLPVMLPKSLEFEFAVDNIVRIGFALLHLGDRVGNPVDDDDAAWSVRVALIARLQGFVFDDVARFVLGDLARCLLGVGDGLILVFRWCRRCLVLVRSACGCEEGDEDDSDANSHGLSSF